MSEVDALSWIEKRLLLEEMNRDFENQKRASEGKQLLGDDPEDAAYEEARRLLRVKAESEVEQGGLRSPKRLDDSESTDSWMKSMGAKTG